MAIVAGFGLGMLALVMGAEWLVKGSVRLAERLGISALVIGLTVVAFGTSAPELAVTMQAAANGSSEIAIGNVVGSNIQNLLLVLGLSAMFVSLKVSRRILRVDMPLLLLLSILLAVMSFDGAISQSDGLLLAGILAVYTWLSIRHGRTASQQNAPNGEACLSDDARVSADSDMGSRMKPVVLAGLQILAGLLLLAEGGNLFVEVARALAVRFGMSELTIGVTVVAFGTSLPEIVTCVVAALRGQRDLAVGNVIGSNIFNILCVLGITSATSGGLLVPASAASFDIPLMLAVTVMCYAVCLSGNRVVRGEGLLMLLIFACYVGWLMFSQTGDSGLRTPIAALGIGLTLLLIGFQVHALSRQSWAPRPARS